MLCDIIIRVTVCHSWQIPPGIMVYVHCPCVLSSFTFYHSQKCPDLGGQLSGHWLKCKMNHDEKARGTITHLMIWPLLYPGQWEGEQPEWRLTSQMWEGTFKIHIRTPVPLTLRRWRIRQCLRNRPQGSLSCYPSSQGTFSQNLFWIKI